MLNRHPSHRYLVEYFDYPQDVGSNTFVWSLSRWLFICLFEFFFISFFSPFSLCLSVNQSNCKRRPREGWTCRSIALGRVPPIVAPFVTPETFVEKTRPSGDLCALASPFSTDPQLPDTESKHPAPFSARSSMIPHRLLTILEAYLRTFPLPASCKYPCTGSRIDRRDPPDLRSSRSPRKPYLALSSFDT